MIVVIMIIFGNFNGYDNISSDNKDNNNDDKNDVHIIISIGPFYSTDMSVCWIPTFKFGNYV